MIERFRKLLSQQTESSPKSQNKDILKIAKLNQALKEGRDIVELTAELQTIEKPILVDFNNVLTNNSLPLYPNPEAAKFVQGLRQVGSVIIVTTARSWEKVQQFLQDFNLWSNDLLLMVAGNYESTAGESYFGDHEKRDHLYQQYELAKKHNLFTPEQNKLLAESSDLLWNGALARKRIAFAFMKTHLIPIIDDSSMATSQNPGMLGIKVQGWYSPEEIGQGLGIAAKGYSLPEAAEEVRKLYGQH